MSGQLCLLRPHWGPGGVELLYTPDYTEWHFMAGRGDVSVEQEQAGNPSRVAAGHLSAVFLPQQPLKVMLGVRFPLRISNRGITCTTHRSNVKTGKSVTLSTSLKSVGQCDNEVFFTILHWIIVSFLLFYVFFCQFYIILGPAHATNQQLIGFSA